MKKLLLLSFLLIPTFCFGQKQKKEEILKLKIDTIENWLDTEYFKIDGDNIVASKVINDIQGTKDELYIKVKNFFARYYNDANSVIQTDDKESGTIIGKGFYGNLYYNLKSNKLFSCYHILRVDIKDNRIRIICSVSDMGIYAFSWTDSYKIVNYAPFTRLSYPDSNWSQIDAFISLIRAMHFTIDSVEKTVKEGAIKGENDDW